MVAADLYVSANPEEHENALAVGGFANAMVLLKQSGLILFQVTEAPTQPSRNG
jgi:hypothetical protein